MNKVVIYPGTFDPITYGHIDVIKKSLKLFDKIIVGVSNVNNKDYLFTSDERIDIVNKALFKDLKLNKKIILDLNFLHKSVVSELKETTIIFFLFSFKSSNKALLTMSILSSDVNK